MRPYKVWLLTCMQFIRKYIRAATFLTLSLAACVKSVQYRLYDNVTAHNGCLEKYDLIECVATRSLFKLYPPNN